MLVATVGVVVTDGDNDDGVRWSNNFANSFVLPPLRGVLRCCSAFNRQTIRFSVSGAWVIEFFITVEESEDEAEVVGDVAVDEAVVLEATAECVSSQDKVVTTFVPGDVVVQLQ